MATLAPVFTRQFFRPLLTCPSRRYYSCAVAFRSTASPRSSSALGGHSISCRSLFPCPENLRLPIASIILRRSYHISWPKRQADEKKDDTPPPPKNPLRALTPHENIYTLPNLLTTTRLVCAPVIGYLLLQDAYTPALFLFAYAGLSDLLDGYLARRLNQPTVLGTILDPLADKALMTILTVTLTLKGLLPTYLAVLILGRDALLALSALYYRWISLPPPKTMARYWDFSLPSAEVRPTAISKVNTALQLVLLGVSMGVPLLEMGPVLGWALAGLQWTVAATTVASGASYVGSKDAVRILGRDGK